MGDGMDFPESQGRSPHGAAAVSELSLPSSCDPPGPSNPPKQRVWVVFGGSGHMGRSVIKAAFAHGDLVTSVGRLHQDTPASMAALRPSSPGIPEGNYQGLLCDVRSRPTVASVLSQALARWGRFDVVANCTGYGIMAAAEDQDEHDVRNQFETNFWGTLNIIHLSLPYFRQRFESGGGGGGGGGKGAGGGGAGIGGRYLIFSSTSGALGVPGLAPYCATKYAVEGLVESMLYEIDAFDIKATLVEPGYVRRDDSPESPTLSRTNLATTTSTTTSIGGTTDPTSSSTTLPTDNIIGVPPPAIATTSNATTTTDLPIFGHFFIRTASPAYAGKTAPAAHAKRVVQWLGDRQPTSAVRAAELVWQLAHCRFPPLRLLLGSYAVESVRDRLRTIIEEIEDWKHLSFGAEKEGSGRGQQGLGTGKKSHRSKGKRRGSKVGDVDGENDNDDDQGEDDDDDGDSSEEGSEDDDNQGIDGKDSDQEMGDDNGSDEEDEGSDEDEKEHHDDEAGRRG